MTHERFEELLDRRLERIREVLSTKSAEYSSTKDKLHNFHSAARMRNICPATALDFMRLKHEVSIVDMINAFSRGKLPDPAKVDEKITDDICYLILLEAIFEDARHESKTEGI